MTGRDLIKWIQEHGAEEYEIVVLREAGEEDFLGSGLENPDKEKKRIVI